VAIRAVKRSAGYRMLRPDLLSIHPTDLWSEEEPRLTFVAFGLRPGGARRGPGIAVFAVSDASGTLVSARLVELGDDGMVAAVHTLHTSPPQPPTSVALRPTLSTANR
jgi:hypothetical protein